MAKKLDFLDFSNADCEHYEPEDVIDDKWKEYMVVEADELKGEFPVLNEDETIMLSTDSLIDAINEAILSLIASEYIPIEISMSGETMEYLVTSENDVDNLHSILTDFGAIQVERDDSIETGFFYITFIDNNYDDEEDEE